MAYSPVNIVIDRSVGSTEFACDLAACKGACCTLPGGRGAPLLDEELQHLTDILPLVQSSLSDTHRSVASSFGPYEGTPGDYHTTCVNHGACVFVTYENGIAHCSIEQAYDRGETTWRKPLSCHLFPIRIDDGPTQHLRFEFITECLPALRRGEMENIPLVAFVSDALLRAFGPSWRSLKEQMKR